MSIQDQDLQQDNFKQPSKREHLEKRARDLNIDFRPSISDSVLQKRIEEKLVDADESTLLSDNANAMLADPITTMRQKATKLVRVIVNPMDPRRVQLNGEIFTVGNGKIGMIGKYVPYNLEAGYYIPQIILNAMQGMKYSEYYQIDDENGNEVTRTRSRNAFVITKLSDLTQEEIEAIANRQRGNLDDN